MPQITCKQLSRKPWPDFDPRLRVLIALFVSLGIVCVKSFTALLLPGLFALILLSFAKPDLNCLGKRFAAVNFFLLLFWLLSPWTTPGVVIYHLGPLHLTQEGLTLAALVTVKANLLTALFTALLFSMEISELGHALHSLKVPSKLIFLLLFAERSLHLLAQEWKNLSQAAKLRGFEARCNLHSYQTLAALLGLLFIRSLDQGKRAHEALLLRGFDGQFLASYPFAFHLRDLYLALLSLAVLCASIHFELAN